MRDNLTPDDLARIGTRAGCCILTAAAIVLIGAGFFMARWL